MKQLLKISDLLFNNGQIEGLPKNPRFIKDDKFKKLVKSIEENPEMLELRELLVYPYNDKYVVIGGNMRLRALKELGYKEVPCKVIPETASVEQLKAYTIKDNNGFGEWDFDLLANEWDFSELEDWGVDLQNMDLESDENEIVEDEAPEVDEESEPITKLGDIWQLGRHRLMCGDSTSIDDVEKLMDGNKADLLLTDPPYNVALGMESIEEAKIRKRRTDGLTIKNDKMEDSEFKDFLKAVFTNAYSVMKEGACFYVWYNSKEHCNFEMSLRESGLETRQQLIWRKSSLIMGRQDYQWNHEPCLYGWKDGAGHLWTSDRKQTTVFDFEKPNKNEFHPTMKPIPLFDYQIKNNTNDGDIVLDLFGGSGTTIMACEQNGRCGYLMELDPHYVDVIIARWEKFTGQKAVLLN